MASVNVRAGLFGGNVTQTGWQQTMRVKEDGFGGTYGPSESSGA